MITQIIIVIIKIFFHYLFQFNFWKYLTQTIIRYLICSLCMARVSTRSINEHESHVRRKYDLVMHDTIMRMIIMKVQ